MRQKEEHKTEGNGGGVSRPPYVSIDTEDDGSRNSWLTFAVIAIVAMGIAAIVLVLTL